MNIDHYFSIGQQHISRGIPCEDYALSGRLDDNTVYGVISDGCGGVDANTDVGARAVSFAFERCLKSQSPMTSDWFGGNFTSQLKNAFVANQISSNKADYFATVVGMVSSPSAASVYIFGDGAFLEQYKSGVHKITWFEFEQNAPYYLAKALSNTGREDFLADHPQGEDGLIRECWTTFSIDEAGKLSLLEEASKPVPFTDFENGFVRHFAPQAAGLEALAVLSDGVTSFSGLEVQDVAKEFTAFKNFAGCFVKRRMIRALADFAKAGFTPRDDVAIACVHYGK